MLEGNKAGKVIIKTCAKIDGKPIVFFASGLTWAHVETLKDIRCEMVSPNFSTCKHAVDYSQATWYDDNSEVPQHYEQ